MDDRWFLSTNDIFVTVAENRPSSSNVRFFLFICLFFKYHFAVYMNTPGSTILESAALRSLNIDGLYPTWLRMT